MEKRTYGHPERGEVREGMKKGEKHRGAGIRWTGLSRGEGTALQKVRVFIIYS